MVLDNFDSIRAKRIAETFRRKKIDNFKKWRDERRKLGIIPNYLPLIRSKDLAEYIGVVLGDGNISNFPRTERLIIVGNSKNTGFIRRYSLLTQLIFGKTATVSKMSGVNAIRMSIYQKYLSKRLGIPSGDRANYNFEIPKWILSNKIYIISLLKGLFEAEGSLSIHKGTYTYNFQFKNSNQSLLKAVTDSLLYLGYHPEVRVNCTRLRKKKEVESFRQLIKFREY
ncbi:MAG TPA: LAGLIDADG family homing endonuclease [Patescibacteria group bacterium]|nr:LAGLIDADG family homing endonuclease [Patescibacteria group bacterium]